MHLPGLDFIFELATATRNLQKLRGFAITGWALLVFGGLAAAVALTAQVPARASDDSVTYLTSLLNRKPPVICTNQTYGLCAGSRCFVFNNVAYCSCDVKHGNSISSPFNFDGGNVCSVNREGANNGYMVSTFSLPPELIAPYGKKALYKCPLTSVAEYAKCDGGICFTSTQGQSFPGFPKLGDHQLVCSCPIKTANPLQGGLEIIGPHPCQASFFENCKRATASSETGATLFDGTSIGSTVAATRLLYGSVPKLNTCPQQ